MERRSDPSDRRAHQVALTAQGVTEIDAYVPHAVRLLGESLGGALRPDELAAMLEMLGRVEASVRARIADREAKRGS